MIVRIFIYIFFSIALLSSKVLIPQNRMGAEKLNISGKDRMYYRLNYNVYNVKGPSKIVAYTRMAVPKNERRENIYSINLELVASESKFETIFNFNNKIDFSVKSNLHPMHLYTKSGKVEFDIPNGEHELILYNNSFLNKPILVRVIEN